MTEKMFGSAAAVKEHIADAWKNVVDVGVQLVQDTVHAVEVTA